MYFIFPLILNLFILLGSFPQDKYPIKKNYERHLEKISFEDRKSLEDFFKHFIYFENFGYVIFGSKPMVYSEFYKKPLSINLYFKKPSNFIQYTPVNINFNVWEKYKHLFKIKKYILKISEDPDEPFLYNVIFINKIKFACVVTDNLDLFKKYLGNAITPDLLLHQIENSDNILEEVLKNRHDLFGLLLGFGLHNSITFQEKQDFKSYLKANCKPPYDKDYFWKNRIQLDSFHHYDKRVLYIHLPEYAEDLNNLESLSIHNSYIAVWEKLCAIYSNGSFLHTTLEALEN